AGGSSCAGPRRPASAAALAGAAGQDAGADLAALAVAGALHAAGGHVVDDAAAGHGAAAGLVDLGVAGEDHGFGQEVVVDVAGAGLDGAAVVELLGQPRRRAGEDHALDVAAAAAHVGLVRAHVERALDDAHVAGEHAGAAVVGQHAVLGVGGQVHGLVAVAGLRPGGRGDDGCGQG